MVSIECKRAMLDYWLREMEGNIGQEWRHVLSSEQLALVDGWDHQYVSGAYELCLKIIQSAM